MEPDSRYNDNPYHDIVSSDDKEAAMSEKKIIAVVGATGAQGRGLVRAILSDPDGGFAVRAITRSLSPSGLRGRRRSRQHVSGQTRLRESTAARAIRTSPAS
jgi:hypothetical protein